MEFQETLDKLEKLNYHLSQLKSLIEDNLDPEKEVKIQFLITILKNYITYLETR